MSEYTNDLMAIDSGAVNIEGAEFERWKEVAATKFVYCEQLMAQCEDLTWNDIFVMDNGVERNATPEDIQLGTDLLIKGNLIDRESGEIIPTEFEVHNPIDYMTINGNVIVEGVDWVVSGVNIGEQYDRIQNEYFNSIGQEAQELGPITEGQLFEMAEEQMLDLDDGEFTLIDDLSRGSGYDYWDTHDYAGEGASFDNFGNAKDGYDYDGRCLD